MTKQLPLSLSFVHTVLSLPQRCQTLCCIVLLCFYKKNIHWLYVPSCFLTCEKLMVPRAITHSNSCVHHCFDFSLAECPALSSFLMLFGTSHLVFCYLNFCSQAPLQMVSRQIPKSIRQFHMLGLQ